MSAKNGKKQTRWNLGIGIVYKRGKSFGIEYKDAYGKRVQRIVKGASCKRDAEKALKKAVSEAFEEKNSPMLNRIRFDEFKEKYIENYAKVNKKSWKTDIFNGKSLSKFFNGLFLEQIDSLRIENYKKAKTAEGSSKATVNRHLALLRKMLNLAVDWKHLKAVPKFQLYSEKDNFKERVLTKEEEERLMNELLEYQRSIIKFALNTGARLREILDLKWENIDLEKRTVKLEKTKAGKIRFLPINSILSKELKNLKANNGHSEFVFPSLKTGEAWFSIRKGFGAACERAGIEKLRFHDLRHTFATRLVENGVDIITLRDILGHSSVRITERYTHSNEERMRFAMDRIVHS